MSLAGIALDDKDTPTVIQVTIKQSKADPFRQGVDLYNAIIGKTGKDICPVCAIIPYLVIRGAKPGPLFTFADYLPVTMVYIYGISSVLVLMMNSTIRTVSG